ncbi:MAG: DNA-3-methyladenine glycosylase 2 family protein [Bacilli bacterium]|jgi:DNA-3-methyladenine glycosylase II|nr:DNA-3-methyladenine glycosylase 2 family protein [Bacilli bacterium]
MTYFKYSNKELAYLKSKDKELKAYIDKVGMIKREIIPDLFQALINTIIGQQISTKAHHLVWQRFKDKFINITPEVINMASIEDIQSCGMTFKKANYIKDITAKIINKEFDLNSLSSSSDEDVIKELTKLKGIGQWSAEMLMIFSMNRMNVLAYDDLAIIRGMKLLYHHQEIKKELFNEYYQRYTPFASVASLYLWHLAGQK